LVSLSVSWGFYVEQIWVTGADWGKKSYREYAVSGALTLPSFPFPFPSLTSPSLPLPFPHLNPIPAAKRPPNPAKGLGSVVSSPNGVRGGAPAANAFFAYFQPSKRIR